MHVEPSIEVVDMAIVAGQTDTITCMDVSIGEVNMSKELHTVWLVLRMMYGIMMQMPSS